MTCSQSELFPVPNPPLAVAAQQRDVAMARVAAKAGPEWSRYAAQLITEVGQAKGLFTSDDVMEAMTFRPHDCRALGPAMKDAQKRGLIRPTGNYKPSRRRHATPIQVWEYVE